MNRRFKRKTVALVLASIITIAGSFASNNFKNSIKALKFDTEASGIVNLTIQTKFNYDATITPVKKDSSTYVIMLPEINDESDGSPELGNGVESIDIRTMPYTTTGKGYTKITLKTMPNAILKAQKAIFIENKEKKDEKSNNVTNSNSNTNHQPQPISLASATQTKQSIETKNPQSDKINSNQNKDNTNTNNKNIKYSSNTSEQNLNFDDNKPQNTNFDDNNSNDLFEIMIIVFSGLLVIMLSVYWFLKNNNKIPEIIGEQPNFDIEDEVITKPKINVERKKASKTIKRAIKNLDKMYEKPVKMPNIKDFEVNKDNNNKNDDSSVIVDLDELFQENKVEKQEENDNGIFDEFLDEFYGAENEIQKKIEEQAETDRYNEELFNKFINDDSIKFSKDDISKIDKLLNLELSEDIMNILEKYNNAEDNRKIKVNDTISDVDKMVAEYTVNQNISFTKEDIDALDKIMNVELDNDFVTNLKTDPKRTEEMTWEILNRDNKKHNTKEILTLKVKDILPNLSEELKKYGNTTIESNARPEVIFADENYDVATFAVDQNLLKVEDENINNKAEAEQDNIMQQDLSLPAIKVDLPTIDNANTYINSDDETVYKEEDTEEMERALREAVQNVTLIPNIESQIITEPKNKQDNVQTPVKNHIQKPTSTEEKTPLNKQADRVKYTENSAQRLIHLIEQKKEEHRTIREARKLQQQENIQKTESVKQEVIIKECVVDGINYQILAKSSFDNKVGCYLATCEEEGYSILGFLGDKIFKIKQYEKIDNTKLQTRESEKLPDGSIRYIVRIGIHKFILDVNDDKMEYVMDLC